MPFADAHCHLDFKVFDVDRLELMRECGAANVKLIAVPGVERRTWSRVLALSKHYSMVRPCLGLHPCFLDAYSETDIDDLECLIQAHPEVIAVGEVGLDFTCNSKVLQIELLEKQIQLANRFDLPVVMHSRKAHNQLLEVIKRNPLARGGVLHGFSGSPEQALSFWSEGVYLGAGGVITYSRAAKSRRAFSELPLESIVLETDSPDMPLSGQQGRRNTPLNVLGVYRSLCDLREERPEDIEAQLWANTQKLFSFDET